MQNLNRRQFVRSFAAATVVATGVGEPSTAMTKTFKKRITIEPYHWKGPYAEYRSASKARHDWRLCAEVRGSWLGRCERIIIRSCEIVGYETGFLYDDHFPPSEPDGRGKNYHHIPFGWEIDEPGEALSADCIVPGKGKFWLRLKAQQDLIDIHMGVRNGMRRSMGNIDWAFCVVGFESPSIADSNLDRTYLFDGERLRSLSELGGRKMVLYEVSGARGFIPIGHKMLPVGSVKARASVVIVEGVDRKHSVALGFEQSDTIYSDAIGNKCFHSDPYFAPLMKIGKERDLRGRLYLMEGNARQALERYRHDFPSRT